MDVDQTTLEIEQRRLTARINIFLGADLNQRTIEKIDWTIKDHCQRCRLQGIDFPEMVAIVLPMLGNVEIVRREQDRLSISTIIVNITRKWPAVSAKELGWAIARAFPEYRAEIAAEAERNRSWQPH